MPQGRDTRRWAEAVAAVLLVDGAVHLYWATGRTWPVRDRARLSQLVLNTQLPFTPPVLLPLVGMLGGAAVLVLVRGGLLPGPARLLPARLPYWGSLAVTGGLLLRGAAGLVWVTGLGADPGDTFYWLNLLLYTPLCWVLAAGAWRVAAVPGGLAGLGSLLRGRRVNRSPE
ncbi:DUF3995 domain-containing protein [Kitasatospora sp. NBC_01287]|uniref:DUF3995 domain-containing protein n=1 Tax=Kitasatospora sp. NBC_01287 TaxID=2903573 RepID=UPI0022536D3E|nr:DUF3995 domain-containing protein [Kitasatospora sp. NBC_01287]MCX4748451.1 DUF3995 domain-containing protein [Kitasatospora sp. NBC_01287]